MRATELEDEQVKGVPGQVAETDRPCVFVGVEVGSGDLQHALVVHAERPPHTRLCQQEHKHCVHLLVCV